MAFCGSSEGSGAWTDRQPHKARQVSSPSWRDKGDHVLQITWPLTSAAWRSLLRTGLLEAAFGAG